MGGGGKPNNDRKINSLILVSNMKLHSSKVAGGHLLTLNIVLVSSVQQRRWHLSATQSSYFCLPEGHPSYSPSIHPPKHSAP